MNKVIEPIIRYDGVIVPIPAPPQWRSKLYCYPPYIPREVYMALSVRKIDGIGGHINGSARKHIVVTIRPPYFAVARFKCEPLGFFISMPTENGAVEHLDDLEE